MIGDRLCDLAAVEFPGQRMVRHQEPLGSISHSLASAVDAAMIGWDHSVSIGNARGNDKAGNSGGTCQSGRDQLTAGEQFAHKRFFRGG